MKFEDIADGIVEHQKAGGFLYLIGRSTVVDQIENRR